ncbi:MAG: ATPase, T2SS/T4P/T4SS family [Candidatus Micrarchaeia archaeon]|jgi:flagellar protein FlaI
MIVKVEITESYPMCIYTVVPEDLTKDELLLSSKFSDLLLDRITISMFCKATGFKEPEALESFLESRDKTSSGKPLPKEAFERFRNNVEQFISALAPKLDAKKVAGIIADAVHGYRIMQPLFNDTDLEEVIINGTGVPILVYHRKYGMCSTNLQVKNEYELRMMLTQIGVDDTKPFNNIRLPDGCRGNIVFEPTAYKTAITIRKFQYKPMSIIDLINNGTLTLEVAAFLWTCLDGFAVYPLNIMVVGGTASGKTTTLNSLLSLVPRSERIVSIEDTLEINPSVRENWVRMETNQKASLEDLVKNALRMRPDRIIVGEIRGSEAEDLFTAMNVGHRGVLATLHANSDRDTIKRLENAPMNVPRSLIPLVDVIVVQNRLRYSGNEMRRHVVQVSEVSRLDDQIALNEIFSWNAETRELERTKLPIQSKEKLAKATAKTINDVSDEMERRKTVLSYLISHEITENDQVSKFMDTFYAKMNAKMFSN